MLCHPASDVGAGRRPRRRSIQEAVKNRSIIVARAGQFWVYEFLFAKQDRANIDDDELANFRRLVKAYTSLVAHQVDQLLRDQDWIEICK